MTDFSQIFTWLQTWDDVIGALGSVALTLALVVLYAQQKQILSRSFRIDNRAIVESAEPVYDAENIRLDLSNVGNGVAIDLELVCIAAYSTGTPEGQDDEVIDGSISFRLNRAEGEQRESGSALKAGEVDVKYEARVRLPTPYGMKPASLEKVFEDLERNGIDLVRLHYFLTYSDLTENKKEIYLGSTEFEPYEATEFSTNHAGWKIIPFPIEVPLYDAESGEYDLSDAETSATRTVF